MPALKLYQWKSSPNSRRIRMFIAEKGVNIPFEPVNLGEGEQRTDWYVAINPRGVVPTLVLEDGTAIGEVPAIMRYLEETFPEPALFGSTTRDHALVTMWERRMELEGFAAVMEAVRNALPSLKGRALAGPHGYEQIPELAERSKQRVKDFYADLDTRLSEVSFVAGKRKLAGCRWPQFTSSRPNNGTRPRGSITAARSRIQELELCNALHLPNRGSLL